MLLLVQNSSFLSHFNFPMAGHTVELLMTFHCLTGIDKLPFIRFNSLFILLFTLLLVFS